jgi:hypothetical protein
MLIKFVLIVSVIVVPLGLLAFLLPRPPFVGSGG